MLVLTRNVQEKIIISVNGEDIVVAVLQTGRQVRVGIEASKNVVILREEVYLRNQQEDLVA